METNKYVYLKRCSFCGAEVYSESKDRSCYKCDAREELIDICIKKTKELFKKKIEKFDKKLRDILYLDKKGKGKNNDDIYDLVEELKRLEDGE